MICPNKYCDAYVTNIKLERVDVEIDISSEGNLTPNCLHVRGYPVKLRCLKGHKTEIWFKNLPEEIKDKMRDFFSDGRHTKFKWVEEAMRVKGTPLYEPVYQFYLNHLPTIDYTEEDFIRDVKEATQRSERYAEGLLTELKEYKRWRGRARARKSKPP